MKNFCFVFKHKASGCFFFVNASYVIDLSFTMTAVKHFVAFVCVDMDLDLRMQNENTGILINTFSNNIPKRALHI